MRKERLENYSKLEGLRNSKVLVYVTSDRQNAETNIGADILAPFANHLDTLGDVDKITLFLYSNGGSTLAGWSLVNLIRSFCKDFEVIIPFRCQSTATLISLGTDRIVMTKQATLGPIDPSLNSPLNPQNPQVPNNPAARVPVSVESIKGYFEFAQKDLNIHNESELKDIYINISNQVHPLVLGDVYRSRTQIQMLAKKLLLKQIDDKDKIENIIPLYLLSNRKRRVPPSSSGRGESFVILYVI